MPELMGFSMLTCLKSSKK